MLRSIGESKLVKPICGLMLMSIVLSFSMSFLVMPIASTGNDKPAKSVAKALPKPVKNPKEEASAVDQAATRQNSQPSESSAIGSNEKQVATNANTWKSTDSVPSTPTKARQSKSGSNIDIYLLARVIHAEARGEPFQGQVAVGAVLLNRLKDSRFPKSLSQIIFKKGEFCTVRDGQIWKNPSQEAIKAARLAAAGWDPTDGALYFYNPAKTTSRWIWSRPVVNQIGNHIFAT